MSRAKTNALSLSRQEWNQPAPFRIEFESMGLRAECLKCNRGNVVWSFAGLTRFMPTFRFSCECGNVAERPIFNSTSGFPAEPVE